MSATINNLECRYIPEPNSGCWIWLGYVNNDGYARTKIGKRNMFVHVFTFESMYGSKPEGLELDHLCRVRCCINPDHLQLVTHTENVRRGVSPAAFHRLKTHCPQGHAYTLDNVWLWRGRRKCKTCHRLRIKRNAK